jgi:hypothetical protein
MINENVKLKRNQQIFFGHNRVPVTYVKKFGPARPNYVIVQFPGCYGNVRKTVWIQDLHLTIE